MGPNCPTLPSKPRTEEWTTPRYITAQEIRAFAARQRACHPPERLARPVVMLPALS